MPATRCDACGDRVPAVTRCSLRWGWVAVLYCGDKDETGRVDPLWCPPLEAARLAGVHTSTLRDWAQHGLITTVHHIGSPIWLYHQPELHVVAELVEALEINSGAKARNRALLAEYVNAALYLGWR